MVKDSAAPPPVGMAASVPGEEPFVDESITWLPAIVTQEYENLSTEGNQIQRPLLPFIGMLKDVASHLGDQSQVLLLKPQNQEVLTLPGGSKVFSCNFCQPLLQMLTHLYHALPAPRRHLGLAPQWLGQRALCGKS